MLYHITGTVLNHCKEICTLLPNMKYWYLVFRGTKSCSDIMICLGGGEVPMWPLTACIFNTMLLYCIWLGAGHKNINLGFQGTHVPAWTLSSIERNSFQSGIISIDQGGSEIVNLTFEKLKQF